MEQTNGLCPETQLSRGESTICNLIEVVGIFRCSLSHISKCLMAYPVCSGHSTCAVLDDDDIFCCSWSYLYFFIADPTCSGHGTCADLEDDGIFRCQCGPGYSGMDCDITPCDDGADGPVCMNGGVCMADEEFEGGRVCTCGLDWYGDRCQLGE